MENRGLKRFPFAFLFKQLCFLAAQNQTEQENLDFGTYFYLKEFFEPKTCFRGPDLFIFPVLPKWL